MADTFCEAAQQPFPENASGSTAGSNPRNARWHAAGCLHHRRRARCNIGRYDLGARPKSAQGGPINPMGPESTRGSRVRPWRQIRKPGQPMGAPGQHTKQAEALHGSPKHVMRALAYPRVALVSQGVMTSILLLGGRRLLTPRSCRPLHLLTPRSCRPLHRAAEAGETGPRLNHTFEPRRLANTYDGREDREDRTGQARTKRRPQPAPAL